jgi:hypothetical protein
VPLATAAELLGFLTMMVLLRGRIVNAGRAITVDHIARADNSGSPAGHGGGRCKSEQKQDQRRERDLMT